MKIVIAPQGFKGSLEAAEVARYIARGVSKVFPEADLVVLPIADGGEGTVRALVQASGGRTITTRVMGPLGHPVNATWGLLGDGRTAVIEMAAASGLPLLRREERNPMRTTTYGTGEMIRHALDHGVTKLIVGIGGSATNDGGAGMAQALGARLLDADGRDVPLGAKGLKRLESIDLRGLDPRLSSVTVEVACDVNNPLLGPKGASAVYGPQKGADPHMVRELDAGLKAFADILERDLGVEVRNVPGAGAAGGLGAGLMAFLHATLRPGVEIVFAAIGLDRELQGADLLITGEGRVDRQDVHGKAPLAAAQLAGRHHVPSIAVVGSTGRDYQVVYDHGLDAVIGTINRPMPLDKAIGESPRLIAEAALRACRLLRVGMQLGQHGGGGEETGAGNW